MNLFLLLFFREVEKIDMNSWKESCTVVTTNSATVISCFSHPPAWLSLSLFVLSVPPAVQTMHREEGVPMKNSG